MMDSDYFLKMEAVREYQEALKYKKMYEELLQSFQYIITDLFDYADKNKIDLPNRERVYRNMEKAQNLIEEKIEKCEPSSSAKRKFTGDEPNDNWTKPMHVMFIC